MEITRRMGRKAAEHQAADLLSGRDWWGREGCSCSACVAYRSRAVEEALA